MGRGSLGEVHKHKSKHPPCTPSPLHACNPSTQVAKREICGLSWQATTVKLSNAGLIRDPGSVNTTDSNEGRPQTSAFNFCLHEDIHANIGAHSCSPTKETDLHRYLSGAWIYMQIKASGNLHKQLPMEFQKVIFLCTLWKVLCRQWESDKWLRASTKDKAKHYDNRLKVKPGGQKYIFFSQRNENQPRKSKNIHISRITQTELVIFMCLETLTHGQQQLKEKEAMNLKESKEGVGVVKHLEEGKGRGDMK